MPQDPNLYGQPPPKKQKKEMALSSSLAFTAQLTSLISKPPSDSPSSGAAPARARPSKSKSDIFGGAKARRKGDRPRDDDSSSGDRLVLRDVVGTEEDKQEAARARRRMEHKARLYAAMKRGDYVPREGEAAPLVDFDRKWAEAQEAAGASSGSDSEEEEEEEEDNNDTEVIEYEDEFGRLRRGTRAAKARMERRLRAREMHAADEERMSARPRAPERLIYGDAVQADAFEAAVAGVDGRAEAMEALARKRDRSATPPEAAHYDADREVRTKGAGFYKFSREEAVREGEMRSLGEARAETERVRREAEERAAARREEVERRRREIEERRRSMGEKRAKKMAESFLDGLAVDLGKDEGETRREQTEDVQ
ncbi:sexual differentiation process protein isp4 [Pleurostoma richardsiae]|uniref:Sexual differentiation process protein isp4 n=1 Tax=Pleurostoma richardsiae TaxID=41990 RepID=A0AA38S888_9PEZI|nr:sexual differentiation process protein isp4 [Pleurostoma richardsiae]